MKKTPDWRLVSEALSSFEFLRDIVEPENQSKEVRDVIDHHIKEKNGIEPWSPGALVAFAYVAIVYSHAVEVFGIPGKPFTCQFNESKPSKNNRELLGNLRNSLAHGDFGVTEDQMFFHHKDEKKKIDWNASISLEDMAVFLQELHLKFRSQHLIGWSHASQHVKKTNNEGCSEG